jgi:hypothetical protein
MPELLARVPDLPQEMAHLLRWHREASISRPVAMTATPLPLPHAAWLAWIEYTGLEPSGMERLLLLEIDSAYCNSFGKEVIGGN